MPTIYRKTDKGRAEVDTRAHRLPPRLRSLLIMADGRQTDVQLAALVPDVATGLTRLAEEGFLEALIERARAPLPLPATRQRVQPPPLPARPEQGPAFVAWRQTTVRALTDAVGPLGEALALRIESTRSATELKPLLDVARQVIRNTRGAGAADAFASRFID